MRIAVDTSDMVNMDLNLIAFGNGVLSRLPSLMPEVIFVFNDVGVWPPYAENVEQVFEFGKTNSDFYFSIDGQEHYEGGPGVITVLSLDHLPTPARPWWGIFSKREPHDFFAEGLGRAKLILVPHTALRLALLDKYDLTPEKIKIVGHGDSWRSLTPADSVTRRITKEVYGNEHSFFFAPSTDHESDNLERLIQAYDLFRQRVPEPVRMLIEQPPRGHTRSVRKAHKQAKFREDVELLSELSEHEHHKVFSSARAILFPSLSTAFPLPVLEAWTAEVPVVYTDNDILRGAGALVQGEDINSIAEGMVSLVTTPFLASGLVENGKRRLKDFSWEAVADKVAGVLREVGGDAGRSRSSEH